MSYLSDNKVSILLQLAKPDRTIIGELNEIKNTQHSLHLGQIHKLTFTIPYHVERNHKKVKNPLFDLVKEKYQIKATYLNKTEWYVVNRVRKIGSDGRSKEIEAFTLPHELSGDKIYAWAGVLLNGSYQKESLDINQVTNNILSESVWTLDYVDIDLTGIYRSFDFQSVTPLQALYEIAQTFSAVIIFNTDSRTVNFYHTDNYGTNKGLFIDYKRYLKTIEDEVNAREIITRIKPYGKDGLTINSVNPTGYNFVDDYSYYLSPFERDINKVVLKHSDWLSDGLCHAILDYNDLVASKETEYQNLLSDRDYYQSEIQTRENTISDKELELITVQDTIQLKQTQGQDASTELAQEDQLQTDIATLEGEIATLQTDLDTTNSSIQTLNNSLAIENNFTTAQLNELSPFINTEIWENKNYFTAKGLLSGAKKRLSQNSKPKSKLNISLVDLMRISEAKKDIGKLVVGDKLYIHYEFFGIDVESQIIEMDINYHTGSISLVIANTKDIERNDDDWLSKLLYQSATTYGTISQNKNKWDNISSVENKVAELMKDQWNSTKREIVSGVNESVTINNQGITIEDSHDANRFIRMTNSVIGLTGDGGNTFRTAITPTGIIAEEVFGKLIAGLNLTIVNNSGTYVMDDSGFNITASNNKVSLNAIDGITISKYDSVNAVWVDKLYTDTNGNIIANDLTAKRIIINDGSGNVLIDANTKKIDFSNFSTVAGKITATNIDSTNLHVNSANIDGMITSDRSRTVNSSGVVYTDVYKEQVDTNNDGILEDIGGLVVINDVNGNRNVKIGAESANPNGGNRGGTIILYDDGLANKRVELGISESNSAGNFNLRSGDGVSRVALSADYTASGDTIYQPYIGFPDSNGSVRSFLGVDYSTNKMTYTEVDTTGTVVKNAEKIATEEWATANMVAKFG